MTPWHRSPFSALLLGALVVGLPATAPNAQRADGGIVQPLTDSPGNPARGRRILSDPDNVTCLICHVLPLPDEPDMGEIGPSLIGVGSRLSVPELRKRLVDPQAFKADSIMPSYFRTEGLYRVDIPYRGRPIYSAQDVEDVVAYLASLKATP